MVCHAQREYGALVCDERVVEGQGRRGGLLVEGSGRVTAAVTMVERDERQAASNNDTEQQGTGRRLWVCRSALSILKRLSL